MALLGVTLALAACQSAGTPAPVEYRQDDRNGPGAARGGGSITVRRGDTVHGLARQYGVALRDLIEANNLRPPYVLEPGRVLVLPGGTDHLVRRGDTLYGIARQYQVDSRQLAELNNLKPPYVIYAGQKLRLPPRGTAAPPTVVAQAPPPPFAQTPPPTVIRSPNAVDAAPPPPPPPPLPSPPPAAAGPATAAAPPAPVPAPAAAGPRPNDEPMDATEVAAAAAARPAPAETAKPPSDKPVGEPPPMGERGFLWPVKGKVLQPFGTLGKGLHNDGINIEVAEGTPVRAAEDGVVAYAGNELRGFGNLLLIKHADGWMSAYAHNQELLVNRGDKVRRGQTIAKSGKTGNVTSPQVHFELRRGTQAVDPTEFLKDGGASAGLDGRPERPAG